MLTREVKTVLDGYSFFENPHWHDGALWVIDMFTHVVLRVDGEGSVETVVELSGPPSGIAWLADGRMLVGQKDAAKILRLESDGSLVTHVDISGVTPWDISDVVVDPNGYVFIGHAGFDYKKRAESKLSSIVRLDPDGTLAVAAEGLHLPNNMSLRDGGTVLLSSETLGQRVTAFDIGADGALTGQRAFAEFGPPLTIEEHISTLLGKRAEKVVLIPDGHTNDAEGAMWLSDVSVSNPGRVVRLREGGEIIDEIRVDGMGVYACELGGDDGRTLFMCACPSWEHRREVHEAKLLACEVDVPRAG